MDKLIISIDSGNASKEFIQLMLEAISDLNRACGGPGVKFKDISNRQHQELPRSQQ